MVFSKSLFHCVSHAYAFPHVATYMNNSHFSGQTQNFMKCLPSTPLDNDPFCLWFCSIYICSPRFRQWTSIVLRFLVVSHTDIISPNQTMSSSWQTLLFPLTEEPPQWPLWKRAQKEFQHLFIECILVARHCAGLGVQLNAMWFYTSYRIVISTRRGGKKSQRENTNWNYLL